MARTTTLPHRWLSLAQAVGGITTLQNAIGLSKMQLWRIAHERSKPRMPVRKLVSQLSRQHNVADPLEPTEAPSGKPDYTALELIGVGLRKNMAPPQVTVDYMRTIWPVDSLVELAETSDNEDVLRAVTWLLEA